MADGSESLATVLERTRELLAQTRTGAAGDPDATHTGQDETELVRVTVDGTGTITAVDIEPTAMRLPSVDLGERVREATNDALQRLRAAAASTVHGGVDLDQVRADLAAVQEDSMRQMATYTQTLDQVFARLRTGQQR